MEDKAIGLERSPSRRRLKTSGDYVGAKGETKDQEPPEDEFELPPEVQPQDTKNAKKELQRIEERISGLEISHRAFVTILEKYDQAMSNNVMVVKKREMAMKPFYDKVKEVYRKLKEDDGQKDKLNKCVASGPAVAFECSFFGDVQAMGDKLRTMVDKNEIVVITGSTPMRQLVEEVPKACRRGLFELTEDGKGKGKGKKFDMWWPLRTSDPSFSIHHRGKVILSCCTCHEAMEQNIMVNTENILNINILNIVHKIKTEVDQVSGLYAVTVESMKNPKPYGRRPKAS